MNQILYNIKENILLDNQKNKKNFLKKKIFITQFVISLFLIFFISFLCISYFLNINNSEKYSNLMLKNYEILRLYSDNDYSNLENLYKKNDLNNSLVNDIFATIQIPTINLHYPVFSSISDESLALSPCKFAGTDLISNSNICIAGHNYDNELFFSNINKLKIGDSIVLKDFNNISVEYVIYAKYEVEASDLSPIYDYDINSKELTLVTCNNINSKRIIIKAKN